MAWWWARVLPSALILFALLSGCLGEGADPAPAVSDEGGPTGAEALATLKGRVLDAALEPIEGVAVHTYGPGGTRSATTEAGGRYEIEGLEPGRHRVQFQALCCREYGGFIELPAGEARVLNVRLEPLPDPQFPYTEGFAWEGFVACSVNAGNTGPSCGATDPNDDRALRFDVQPGLKTMLVAMDWTAQSMNWDEAMRFRVMHGNCNSNGASCTYVHARGPPPLEAAIDEKTGRGQIHFANITEEQRITVRVWPDGTPNIVYQQPFTVYFEMHYWAPAPEGRSALPA